MINKKISLVIILGLVLLMPLTSASWFDWFFDVFSGEESMPENSLITIVNGTDSQWNMIKHSGDEANFKLILTDLKDKKTDICFVLKDGIDHGSVDLTDKFIYDIQGSIIQDDKDKDLVIKYETSKCDGVDGYHLSLTDTQAINIDEYIKLGEESIIIIYQPTNKVIFDIGGVNISSTLYWDVYGDGSDWNNTINDIFVSFDNNKYKFGANHSGIEWEHYKYVISSQARLQNIKGKWYFRNGLGGYKVLTKDICSKFNNVNNETADCKFNSYSVFNNLTNETTYFLEVEFYSDSFIDPSFEFEIIDSETLNEDVRIEGDGSAHISVNDSSLVLYMPFDSNLSQSTVYDYTNFDNDGSIEGDAHFINEGIFGGAFKFDKIGTDDFIDLGTPDSLNFTDMSFSMSVWVRKFSTSATGVILSRGNEDGASGQEQYILSARSGSWRFRIGNATDTISSSGGTSNNAEWQHIVGIYNGSRTLLYVNGILMTTSGNILLNPLAEPSTRTNAIGAESNGDRNFNGTIDEVMIFNRALSTEEVADIFRNGTFRFNQNDSNIVVHYHLDNDASIGESESLVVDVSGNGNNGNVVGDAIPTTDGKFLGAYNFDATDGYIDAGNSDELKLINTSYTISLWVKSFDTDNANRIFTHSDDSVGYTLQQSSGGTGDLVFQVNGGTILDTPASSFGVDNKWYYLAITFNSSDLNTTIYIDNVVGDSEIGENITSASESLFIGARHQNPSSTGFNGSIDEFMIFNKTLSPEEITQLFNNQSVRFKKLGTQTFKETNLTLGSDNKINLTINSFQTLKGSTMSARIGSWGVNNGYNVSDAGLVLYMGMNNQSSLGENNTKVVDLSGNDNNGTVIGGASPTSDGRFNGGFTFDGDDDYIGLSSRVADFGGNFTISVWIKPTSVSGTHQIVTSGGQNQFLQSGTQLKYFNFNSGVGTLVAGQWTHAVVTQNDTNLSIYADGVLKVTTSNFSDGTSNIFIGTWSGSSEFWNGSIDEVAIWNRSLSAQEIKSLYIKGLAIYNFTQSRTVEVGDNIFQVPDGQENYLPELTYTSGNGQFYTPILEANVSINTFSERAFDGNNNVFRCGVIDVPGVYTQNQSITTTITCITINSSDVYFDGDGFTIDGASTGRGIDVIGASGSELTNVTIKNVNINDFNDGIQFSFVDNSLIDNSSVRSAGDNGFELQNSHFNLLTNLNATLQNGLSDAGIYILTSTNNNITNGTFDANEIGIYFANAGADNNIVTGANITNSESMGIDIHNAGADDNLIYNNFLNNTNNINSVAGAENFFNTSLTATTSIIGGSNSGGNYWSSPDGGNYSDTCTVTATDNICDNPMNVSTGLECIGCTGINIDELPLSFQTAGEVDESIPIIENIQDNNGTLEDSGIVTANFTIENTNGTAGVEFDGTNHTAVNVSNFFNVSFSQGTPGVFTYFVWAYGNGTDTIFNRTELFDYTVNESVVEASISIERVFPTTNINVTQNEFFNVTLNVTCLTGNCGEINVSLDPIEEGTYTGVHWDTAIDGLLNPWTIAHNSTNFFITNSDTNDDIYIYYLNGTFVEVYEIDNNVTWASGVEANDTNLWIADALGDDIYLFDFSNNVLGNFSQVGANSNTIGITQNETFIWTIDSSDDQVYKYYINGTYTGINWDTASVGNADPRDITTNNEFIWITDFDLNVYKYDMEGSFVSSWIVDAVNVRPRGITNDGTFFWITDETNDEVYKYNMFASTSKSGLINTTIGATPFYTNASTNPLTTSSLSAGQSEIITFWVNATGEVDVDVKYDFFAFANTTTDLSISNETTHWNVTINESGVPVVDNEFPIFTNIGFNITDGSQYFESTYLANTTILSSNGTAGIEFDGVNFTATNVSELFSANLGKLAVGSFNYFWWSFGNGTNTNFNITETFTYDVVINSTLTLGISGTTPIEYPQVTDVSGSDCPSELSCNLSGKANQIYPAGIEEFNFSTSGNENYTQTSITIDITINKNVSYNLGLTASTPITYGDTTDFTGTGCPGEITCTLNISNEVYEAGTISANYSTPGNNNYTANSTTFTVTINQAVPEGTISGATPIDYPTAGDVEGSESNTGDGDLTYQLFRDGSLVSNPDTTILSAGSYDYVFNTTGGTNYTANASMDTFTLVVNQAVPEGTIAGTTPIIEGNAADITGSESNTGDGDVVYELFREGDLVSNPDTSVLGAGNYNYVFNTTGGTNYTANASMDTFILVVTSDEDFPIFTNIGFNITNGTEYFGGTYLANVTITSTNGTSGIEFDGANFTATNISELFSVNLEKLAVGDYNYYWWSFGNGTDTNFNRTETLIYSVVINSSLTLGIDGTTPIEYLNVTNVVGSGCPSELSCNLSGKANQVYGAGIETFNFSTSGNENYTQTSITIDITINKNVSYNLGLTASTPITYGDTTDFVGTGCPDEISCTINISDEIYAAGTISANYSTPGNNNYTANSTTFTVTINQAIPEGTLTGTTPIIQGAPGDVDFTESNTGDGDLDYEVYRDGSLVVTPDTDVLGAGSYDYILNTTGGTNYTANASMDTFTLVVTSDEDFPIFTNIEFNITNGTEYFGGSYLSNVTITNNNGTAGIEFDGVNYTATNISDIFTANLEKLKVNDYNYFWWAYGNGTDTNFNKTETLIYSVVINSSLTLEISGTTPITYPTVTDVAGSGCPDELTCILDKANQIYGAGTEEFNFSTTGNENYTQTSITKDIIINQATGDVEVYLNTQTNNITIEVESTITYNASRLAGEVDILVYKDEVLTDSGVFTTNTTTPLTLDSINITAILIESQNYTADSLTRYINVTDTTAPLVNIIHPQNISYNINQSELNYTVSDLLLDTCWYSIDFGDTNTTITCGTNVTGLEPPAGSSTYFVYANDTSNNIGSDNVTFNIDETLVSVPKKLQIWRNKSNNINVSSVDVEGNWLMNLLNITNNLFVGGKIQALDYFSGDGSQGMTGTCLDGTNLVIKDGLIISCS